MSKKNQLTRFLYPALLFVLVSVIFVTNYEPGSFLLGWDSLSTEFYPWLGVKRSFFSVWQEYQSFGLVSGMAHAADLVRSVFLWVISPLLPVSLARYFFHSLMLFVGALGVFKLLTYLGFKKEREVFAFVGAVFYVLNLGTVQIFGIPFEAFSVFFGLLPWELWIFLRFVNSNETNFKKVLVLFLTINLLATPQAYVQTLFLVYVLILCCFSIPLVFSKSRFQHLKRVSLGFVLIFLINSFWILPQVYFLRTNYDVVSWSKINQISTGRVLNRNLEKGRLDHFAKMEGFYYDTYDTKGDLLFQPWKDYLGSFPLSYGGYFFFFIAVLGLFGSRRRYHLGFITLFALISVALLGSEFPFSLVNEELRGISFVNQIFRSPFTKFVIPYSLLLSYLVASGLGLVHGRVLKDTRGSKAIVFLALSLIILYTFPVFTGNFFVKQMRVKLPESYTQVINYFRTSAGKDTRVALLPEHTYWGWFKNDWGYDGSGFLWYGLEQPVVSRTFDVWSLTSESYFWEIKEAIEDQDLQSFEAVLAKYSVDYLVLDRSLQPISSDELGMQYDQLDNIVPRSTKVHLVETFGSLEIYSVNRNRTPNSFISSHTKMSAVGPSIALTDEDNAYFENGMYATQGEYEYFYPFLDFMTKTDVKDRKWVVRESENSFFIEYPLNGLGLDSYELEQKDIPLKGKVFLGDGEEVQVLENELEATLEDEKLVVKVSRELVYAFGFGDTPVENCSYGAQGSATGVFDSKTDSMLVETKDGGKACFGHQLSTLAHWNGYLVRVETESLEGDPFFFYIAGNSSRRQSKGEANLKGPVDYFLLSPGEYSDDGYLFSFQGVSYGGAPSVNRVDGLELYLFPFEYIKNIRLRRKDVGVVNTRDLVKPAVRAWGYHLYDIKDLSTETKTLVLNQSFDNGWVALCGTQICDAQHVKVNNWANGWVFEEGTSPEVLGEVRIVFWPQALEYVGLLLAAVTLITPIFIRKKSPEVTSNISSL